VVPESGPAGNTQASEFGEALGEAWAGATVDLAVHDDPIGATFIRIAKGLEGTAKPVSGIEPTRSLTTLTARPGRANRKLWLWSALVMTAASALLGVIAWQWKREAIQLNQAAELYQIRWQDEVRKAYSDALTPRPEGPLMALRNEVERRRAELMPERPEEAMPILDELETISLVIGAGDFTLERLDVGADLVRLSVVTKDLSAAEAFAGAMSRISGSHVDWRDAQMKTVNDNRGGAGASGSVQVSFDCTWVKRKDDSKGGVP